ncbi:MAG: hypothetical protein AB7K52_10755 [Phycisphaerales bacterium]
MTESRGVFTGPDRAARTAGALAEAGIIELHWRPSADDADAQTLYARQTDLPGLMARAAAGASAQSPDGSVRITIESGAVGWLCTGSARGRSAAAILQAAAQRD